ncbi:hypothetical protein CDAR_71791 [Caerostris darwini]|uniref:Uncharacterized protein n=1 Tax=Caerostris darwini TaxID=1538125 RepID=A0AAV4TKG9_9ARAC|nr:hypothetical protein CDAR_71791 [Caerostris darwini]
MKENLCSTPIFQKNRTKRKEERKHSAVQLIRTKPRGRMLLLLSKEQNGTDSRGNYWLMECPSCVISKDRLQISFLSTTQLGMKENFNFFSQMSKERIKCNFNYGRADL